VLLLLPQVILQEALAIHQQHHQVRDLTVVALAFWPLFIAVAVAVVLALLEQTERQGLVALVALGQHRLSVVHPLLMPVVAVGMEIQAP
jgi:hypothetical protein